MNAQGSPSSENRDGGGAEDLRNADISLVPLDRLERLAAHPADVRPQDQIWEALRELGATRMRQKDLGEAIRLRWARPAATAVSHKYGGVPGSEAKKDVDLVQLRAAAIAALGPDPEDPDRNPELLFRYIARSWGASYDDLAAAAADRRQLPPADILRLRRVKNMLSAARGAAQHLSAGSPVRDTAEKWLALLPKLP